MSFMLVNTRKNKTRLVWRPYGPALGRAQCPDVEGGEMDEKRGPDGSRKTTGLLSWIEYNTIDPRRSVASDPSLGTKKHQNRK